ncbi:hypothetical protein BC829DRAFT_439114 [Chytridium lagenaria]|nr:hypothetical protein BC829DRAFT_439114 [Chytridium lagenaria]
MFTEGGGEDGGVGWLLMAGAGDGEWSGVVVMAVAGGEWSVGDGGGDGSMFMEGGGENGGVGVGDLQSVSRGVAAVGEWSVVVVVGGEGKEELQRGFEPLMQYVYGRGGEDGGVGWLLMAGAGDGEWSGVDGGDGGGWRMEEWGGGGMVEKMVEASPTTTSSTTTTISIPSPPNNPRSPHEGFKPSLWLCHHHQPPPPDTTNSLPTTPVTYTTITHISFQSLLSLSTEQSVTTNPPDEEVAIQQTPDQTTSALELVVHTQQGPSAPIPSRVQAPTPASMINEARGILKNLNDTFMDSKNNADMTQRSHTENIIIILFVLHDVQRLTEKDIEDLVGASLTDILQNFRMSVKTPQKCMQSLLKTLNVLVDLKPVIASQRKSLSASKLQYQSSTTTYSSSSSTVNKHVQEKDNETLAVQPRGQEEEIPAVLARGPEEVGNLETVALEASSDAVMAELVLELKS